MAEHLVSWRYWTTSASTTATTSNITWYAWAGTGATTTAPAWSNWTGETFIAAMAPRTPEQVAADADRARVALAQREEQMARERADREEAVQRAETLLHQNLTRHQRRTLRGRGRFFVRSEHGRRYEIERGHHANVYEVDPRGRRVNRLCVYATGGVPEADCMLAQKLMLQADEERLRRVANITPVRVA